MKAYLNIFSGRPNPGWELTDDEAAEVRLRLRNLPDSPRVPVEKLGYMGFILRRSGNDISSQIDEVRVYGGILSYYHDEGRITYKNDITGLESWLEDQARQKGYGHYLP